MDIEVYGLTPDCLRSLLGARFMVDVAGKSFEIIKIHELPIDVSIPQHDLAARDRCKRPRQSCDPFMRPEDAASRRDFTINAMAYDLLTGQLFDPYNGLRDIRARILRHTSNKFADDPLRVLRGMQFAARFNLEPAPETISICRTLSQEGIAKERVFEEWRKLILRGQKPSKGLSFLRACAWTRYYPELEALIGCKQDPERHPEGDVWNHTLHCLNAFATQRLGADWEDLVVGFAVLCHDFGKPARTRVKNGRITAVLHDIAGVEPAKAFLKRLTNQEKLIHEVVPLVKAHMRP